MSSIFSRIIQGEIPCHKILEDEFFLAFLDIRPINPGHTLVVPKVEVDRFFDLEDKLLQNILVFSKSISQALEKTLPCKRVGLIVAGLEIPHAHIHLVPLIQEGDLTFERARPANPGVLKELAEKIKANLK